MAFAALMKGESVSASSSIRPSRIPKTMPSSEPITNPTTASSMVTAACSQSGPSAVPSVIQVQSRATTPDGWPTKNGSTQLRRVDSSQLPIQTTANSRRRP